MLFHISPGVQVPLLLGEQGQADGAEHNISNINLSLMFFFNLKEILPVVCGTHQFHMCNLLISKLGSLFLQNVIQDMPKKY